MTEAVTGPGSQRQGSFHDTSLRGSPDLSPAISAFLSRSLELGERAISGRELLQYFFDPDLKPIAQNFSILKSLLNPYGSGFVTLRDALRDAGRCGLLYENRDTGAYYPSDDPLIKLAVFPPTEGAFNPEIVRFLETPLACPGVRNGLNACEVLGFLGEKHTLTEAYRHPAFFEPGASFNPAVRDTFEKIAEEGVAQGFVTKTVVSPTSARPYSAEEYAFTMLGLKYCHPDRHVLALAKHDERELESV